jgi:hypothetical protein
MAKATRQQTVGTDQAEGTRRYKLSQKGLQALRKTAARTKPWMKSTGPKTARGKMRSRMNGLKHGMYSANAGKEGLEYRRQQQRLRDRRKRKAKK